MDTATQTAPCPRCGRLDCIVREAFAQATRHEPMRSLGFQAYCRSCDVHFRVERGAPVQLSL